MSLEFVILAELIVFREFLFGSECVDASSQTDIFFVLFLAELGGHQSAQICDGTIVIVIMQEEIHSLALFSNSPSFLNVYNLSESSSYPKILTLIKFAFSHLPISFTFIGNSVSSQS